MTDMTPEERAASTDYTENLSLLKYCTGVSPFHEAAARCDVLALRRCMATYGFTRYPKYVGIHSKSAVLTCAGETRAGSTALHALCLCDGYRGDRNTADIEVCFELLLEAGADIDARDDWGFTSLRLVAELSSRGHGPWGFERDRPSSARVKELVLIASLLIRHGADVDAVCARASPFLEAAYTNEASLHVAAACAPMMALLVKAGASVNSMNVDGYTPLDIAIQWNARAAVAILLRAGAGRTPFINEHVLGKVLPHQATAALHVRKVIDGGGFKKYEQDHLATLTNTFEPKFTMLPKELVRHVVSFWLHAGYY